MGANGKKENEKRRKEKKGRKTDMAILGKIYQQFSG
jgi:hypothetical protein